MTHASHGLEPVGIPKSFWNGHAVLCHMPSPSSKFTTRAVRILGHEVAGRLSQKLSEEHVDVVVSWRLTCKQAPFAKRPIGIQNAEPHQVCRTGNVRGATFNAAPLAPFPPSRMLPW
jgi:hypothetical protein